MDIENVLVEYESTQDKEVYANSGLAFSNRRYVIITGNVLMPYIKNNQSKIENLRNAGRGSLHFDHNFFPNGLKVVSRRRWTGDDRVDSGAVCIRRAKVLALFFCPNISTSSRRYLKEWAVDRECNTFLGGLDELVSLFFVLQVMDDDGKFEEEEAARKGLLEGMKNILIETKKKKRVCGGEKVWIESTPFGNRIFLNSYSEGVVSIVTGLNGCFLLTDCATSPGCEGSPVFFGSKTRDSQLRSPLGIVVSCLNWWKGEWVGLTLVANWWPLLSQFIELPLSQDHAYIFVDDHLWSKAQKSLVQVVSESSWGTGILLDKRKGIFLTNAHVLSTELDSVKLFWRGHQLSSRILYKTPNEDVYDLAVMRCSSIQNLNALDVCEINLSQHPAKEGEEVYAAGYPLFGSEFNPTVSLTKGHVARVQKSMITTTCNVLPGASGGAILRPDGQAIGVIVSNTKMGYPGVVFPRVNMAIPISEIKNTISSFLKSGDAGILQRLQVKESVVCRPWLQLSGKL